MVGHVRFATGEIVIDKYDAAAKTISSHFSGSGKDESSKPEELTDGKFSGIPVTEQQPFRPIGASFSFTNPCFLLPWGKVRARWLNRL
ncbi:hypothetical protein FJW06_07055 [Mesorhizobium sp. B4-1-3]|uniref:hypothetical protein n=1 Tax=Mesorhizobium sp. B4-1-3 TaxID=2589889 RepID=UPI00112D7E9B|nr:hypothetical protein [Mesorhizobium sp. B4-1-3]TPI15160.1 hypothetical protein FJW06_07055 [Mesorhizobium sp. B4-1-3]